MAFDPRDTSLLSLEWKCRTRLTLRPYAVAERVVLALILELRGEAELARQEWDEALYQTQRQGDGVAQESCRALMGILLPREEGGPRACDPDHLIRAGQLLS